MNLWYEVQLSRTDELERRVIVRNWHHWGRFNTREHKYTGKNGCFYYKFKIFISFFQKAGMPRDGLLSAFSLMLKDEALDYTSPTKYELTACFLKLYASQQRSILRALNTESTCFKNGTQIYCQTSQASPHCFPLTKRSNNYDWLNVALIRSCRQNAWHTLDLFQHAET